jgi:hypothetical protein
MTGRLRRKEATNEDNPKAATRCHPPVSEPASFHTEAHAPLIQKMPGAR